MLSISYGLNINDFLDIEICSRGFDQVNIKDVDSSFIKINGGESLISSIVNRGLNSIILNRTTGNIKNMIAVDTYNISTSSDSDSTMNNFLLTASPDDVIVLQLTDLK